MRHRAVHLLRVVLLCSVTAVPAFAQIGRASGLVKDSDNRPIKGATVVFENPQVSPSSFTAVTDEKGRFAVVGLRTGTWTVTASAPGFEPQAGAGRMQGMANNPAIEFHLVRSAPMVPTPLAGVDMKELQASLTAADAQLAAGQFDSALAGYRAILAKTPVLSSINLQIAQAYRGRKDYDKAIAALLAAADGGSVPPRISVQVGLTQLEKGDVAAAEATLAPLADAGRPAPDVLVALAELRLAQHRPDQAAALLDRAAASDAQWALPHVRLAEIAVEQGDVAGARQHADQALRLQADGPEAARARAVLEKLGAKS